MKSRARIKSPNPRGSITMKEVAAEAGVSMGTVSRALASPIGVAANSKQQTTTNESTPINK
jgi:hypothetical protein